MKENIFSRAVEAGGKLLVRSALNPILWLCGIIYIPTLFAAILRPELPVIFIYIGLLPIVIAVVGFLFLLFFDRDKLQSEEFQIQKKTIEMAYQQGDEVPAPVSKQAIITNPAVLGVDPQGERK